MGLQLCEAPASETRPIVPLRILASSSAVHMSPRLLSTAIAPSAAAATAAAAAPVAPTDDSHDRRCDPVVEPSLAEPIEVRAEAPAASSGER